MSSDSSENTGQTLGEILHTTRISLGLDFDQISHSTKISVKNLRAMEEDDYDSLPAEVFTRGFYALYAKQLSLEPSLILKQYNAEKSFSRKNKYSSQGVIQHGQDYRTMAERPNSMPFSCIGLLVMLLLILGAFLSWYFSWNPATYLSQKIRSDKETSQKSTLQSPEKEFFEIHNMLNIPSITNASEIKQQFPSPVVATDKYIIKAQFKETTKVTLAIDDKPVYDSVYNKGDSVAWSAKNKMNITLPGKTATLLSMNKTPIHLPKADNATLTISIPYDLDK